MKRTPKVTIDRFAKLNPGDIFVYLHSGGSCLALKVVAEDDSNAQLVLPLGPIYPPNILGPRLFRPAEFTAISYGKDYTLRLPGPTSAWRQDVPTEEVFCLAVDSDETYFRASFGPPGDFRPCFVRASDGCLIYTSLPNIRAYVVEWKITVGEGEQYEQILVKHP